MKLRYTSKDYDRANRKWGANCGPSALAAVLGRTLNEVWEYAIDFKEKGCITSQAMREILGAMGIRWRENGSGWPSFGLVTIAWNEPHKDGYWTSSAHWIGVSGDMVFDVNAVHRGEGWLSRSEWEAKIVPALIKGYRQIPPEWAHEGEKWYRRALGMARPPWEWRILEAIEVER